MASSCKKEAGGRKRRQDAKDAAEKAAREVKEAVEDAAKKAAMEADKVQEIFHEMEEEVKWYEEQMILNVVQNASVIRSSKAERFTLRRTLIIKAVEYRRIARIDEEEVANLMNNLKTQINDS